MLGYSYSVSTPVSPSFMRELNIVQQMLPSTHYDERVDKQTGQPVKIDMLIFHASSKPAYGVINTLFMRGLSAHYVIGKDGTVIQCVPEEKRAWHAGNGTWHGVGDLNAHSIGIEIENPTYGHGHEYTPAQVCVIQQLSAAIIGRYHIRPENIMGHSDVAPTRKPDPGRLFPWAELAKEGIGLWPTDEAEVAVGESPKGLLEEIGYPTQPLNLKLEDSQDTIKHKTWLAEMAALYAFQRRFMPASIPDKENLEMDTKEYLRHLESELPSILANKRSFPDEATLKRLKTVAFAYRRARSETTDI